MRIATEHYKSYHRHVDEKKENENLSKGMERIFGKPWYEEDDPKEAERKRKEKGL
jgi:hypothetical protein